MGQNEAATLGELIELDLNKGIMEEFEAINFDLETTMAFVSKHIQGLRHSDGRKIRRERLSAMTTVLSILYDHVTYGRGGQCSPSMKRIAYTIDPQLVPSIEDDKKTLRRKERLLGNLLMVIQRAIEMLANYGFLKIHTYRSATNQNVLSHPNFYYELVPIASFCSDFEIYIRRETQAVFGLQRVFTRIKDHILSIEKIGAAIDGIKQKAWEFPESRLEKWFRGCGVFAYG